MKHSTMIVCIAIGIAYWLSGALAEESRGVLDAAKEKGRSQSRYLKETKPASSAGDRIPKADIARYRKSVEPILARSCVACHGPKMAKGGFRIDRLNPDMLAGPDAERWRDVHGVLSKSEMPPENEPAYALSEAERGYVADWLGEELNKASLVRRNGREHSSFRRLTKYEYDHALQDILGLSYPLAGKLPPEPTTEDGFQNSSELLQITGVQLGMYREIALKALKRATVSGERPKAVTYSISMRKEFDQAPKNAKGFEPGEANAPKFKNQKHLLNRETGRGVYYSPEKALPNADTVAGEFPPASPVVLVLPAGDELKLNLDRFLPDEGMMRVRIRASRSTMNPDEYAGLSLLLSAHTSNDANFKQVISQRDIPVTAPLEKPEYIDFHVPLADIQRNPFRKLATTFPRRDEFLHIHNNSNATGGQDRLKVLIDQIEVTAPFYDLWPPKTHTAIFFESNKRSDESAYGREVLGRFLRRVWRRPVAPGETDRFMALFEKYRPEFPTFEDAIVEVLATALASPEFLYLTQRAPNVKAEDAARISELELASRMAIFLWSSVPDEELLGLAEQGKLREPKVLAKQVERMLGDPKARRLPEHFVGQWLGLEGLNSVAHLPPGPLREAIQEEPIAFFEEAIKNNRSVMDFIHSDYAMVNERLAAHYGIAGVRGPHFRRVPNSSQAHRGGLLTGAAFLAMNSDGKDSNPLKRGVWVLKRILHDPPPPPPPDVPKVDLTNPEILKMSLKERLADHRDKAACRSCHSRIDPWGIAFENFDALGVFRTQIDKKPVDATAELFNHKKIAGVDGLKAYLLEDRQDQFAKAMTHKLTAYALGRPITFGDRSEIESLTRQFRQGGDGLRDLIHLIVGSRLFNAN
jgi:mono/diheme cytochrome c family protein